jgi:hypothetical protein
MITAFSFAELTFAKATLDPYRASLWVSIGLCGLHFDTYGGKLRTLVLACAQCDRRGVGKARSARP